MDFDSWQAETETASPNRSSAPRNQRLKLSSTILIVAGVVVALAPLYTIAYGSLSQWLLKQQWSSQLTQKSDAQASEAKKGLRSGIEDEVLAASPSANDVSSQPGGRLVATKITIPKIGVDQVVLEGSHPEILKNGPGHYRGMALPGERGNVGIAGHRVTWTKPFNRLDELSAGDLIILDTFEKRFEYRVAVSKVLDPKDTSMLRPTSDARVTLTTCNPKFSARTRLDVQGVLVRTVDKTPKVIRVIDNFRKGVAASVTRKPKPKPARPEFSPRSELELALQRVKNAPNNPRERMRLGVIYLDSHRPASAAAQFSVTAKLSPSDPLAQYYWGLAKKAQGHTGDAATHYLKAVSLRPNLEPALFELGRIELAEGDYATARNYFERASKLVPLEAETHYYLGFSLEKLGERKDAAQHYRTVLKYIPGDERAKSGLKRIGID